MSDQEDREIDELEEQSAELLPDREAMSVIGPPQPLQPPDVDYALILPGSPGADGPDPPPTTE